MHTNQQEKTGRTFSNRKKQNAKAGTPKQERQVARKHLTERICGCREGNVTVELVGTCLPVNQNPTRTHLGVLGVGFLRTWSGLRAGAGEGCPISACMSASCAYSNWPAGRGHPLTRVLGLRLGACPWQKWGRWSSWPQCCPLPSRAAPSCIPKACSSSPKQKWPCPLVKGALPWRPAGRE